MSNNDNKPLAEIREAILKAELFLLTPEQIKAAPVETVEELIKYWEDWLRGVAGKQIFDLLELKALAEQVVIDKKREYREFQKFKQRQRELTELPKPQLQVIPTLPRLPG